MKKGMVLWAVFILTVTLVLPALGAEAPKPGGESKPGMQVPQQKTPTKMMPTVRGHVKHTFGQGMARVEMTLSKIGSDSYKTYTTDGAGAYHFTLTSEDIGGSFKIVPKYKDFPTGQHFTPNEKQFTLADGDNTIDFSFTPLLTSP